VILLISLTISGESTTIQSEEESATCLNDAGGGQTTKNSPFFNTFLEAYGKTVDTMVGLQTTTWNYIARYHHFDESKMEGMCDSETIHRNVPKFARNLNTTMEAALAAKKSVKTWALPDGFKHDRESDIDKYFKELEDGCNKPIPNATAADEYVVECLDKLKSIVYEPRCTTRYDSRVNCNGDAIQELSPPSELIKEHFGSGEDSLNVVIIGAGPIGLMLGNALSMLHSRKKEASQIPRIKILCLETRADAPGFKRAYIRNWQAHLNLLHFRHTVDPRLLTIIAAMSDENLYPQYSTEEFVLPLNVIETLLMLSNRDMGAAKFLFGVNPLDIVEDLRGISNLVLVDATGHRLEPLRRGSVCDDVGEDQNEEKEDHDGICAKEEDLVARNHRTPPPPEIPWKNQQNRQFYNSLSTFLQDFSEVHDYTEARGQHLHVGYTGDLMYPVDEMGVPKSMWWLDVHGAKPLTFEEYGQMEEDEVMYANEGPFCKWCLDFIAKIQEGNFRTDNYQETDTNYYHCSSICYTPYYAQSTSHLREDINRNIFNGRFNDTFVFHSDSWFPINGYSFNPSVTLAHEAKKVLMAHGFAGHPIGMPLRDFYPALVKSIKDDVENDVEMNLSLDDIQVIGILKKYTHQTNTTKWPTVTLFVQQPFIYTNGIKKKNKCLGKSSTNIGDHLDEVPMIRFGDAFTTGDGLRKYNRIL